MRNVLLIAAVALAAVAVGADKKDEKPAKHSSGRPLPAMPKIDKVVAFDTKEADAILEALQVFPEDNPWNADVSKWPLHANSKNLIASIGNDKVFRMNDDMGFV